MNEKSILIELVIEDEYWGMANDIRQEVAKIKELIRKSYTKVALEFDTRKVELNIFYGISLLPKTQVDNLYNSIITQLNEKIASSR